MRVYGSASNGNASSFKGAPLPMRDFFLYRIDKNTTDDDIKKHLIAKGIKKFELLLQSNEASSFKAYKLSVQVTDKEVIFNPNTWPEGVNVRKWIYRSNNTRSDMH